MVCSTDEHPFYAEEYIAVVVTTTARSEAIELATDAFIEGSLPRRSYVSPWNPVTLKDDVIGKHVATVRDSIIGAVVVQLNTYFE